MSSSPQFDFDVAVVGAGPAGLSAAVTLGRALRRVLVLDHGKPRNFAARAVHGFLGSEGLSPWDLRELGRKEATAYGVLFLDAEVTGAECISKPGKEKTAFRIKMVNRQIEVRSILFATGTIDVLPKIPGLKEFYGSSVHHCPYCDGWEHQNQSLVALGTPISATKLARTLLGWSKSVTACTNGESIPKADRETTEQLGIAVREQKIRELSGADGVLRQIFFDDCSELPCDALFFSGNQGQRSVLPRILGCEYDQQGLLVTRKKQTTSVEGVFVAGDADGDVQFAIVAAAEGSVAAAAIHQALLDQDQCD